MTESSFQSSAAASAWPLVSVVILNWNGRAFLEQFLPSVMASTYGRLELIVADNASTDDSVSFLQQHYPTVRLIRLSKNLGFAGGYNAALKEVKADYYVLLNSDVEVTPGWIEPVIAHMESDPQIAAAQPKMLAHRHPQFFEYAGAAGGWIDRFGYPFSRGRVFDVCEEDRGQYNDKQPCFWASGAAMFVRAAVYHELGGFDEGFFAHQEEIDLCWRMHRNGYTVWSEPASVVYHVGGGTLPKGNRLKTLLNFRNNLMMLYKNLPTSQLWWILPVRIGLDAVSAWKELFSGQGGYFVAVARAHGQFFHWLFTAKQKRVPGKKEAGMAVYRGLIVWDYFVKKRRHFSQIVGNKSLF